MFSQIISEYNCDIYGFSNDQAYVPVGTRLIAHHLAPTPPIGINDAIHLNGNGFDDTDSINNDPNFYYNDYDAAYGYSGVSTGIVGATHQLDIPYPTVAAHARGTYPLHSYHNSHSMHHEHIGKNLNKIQ